MNVICIVANLYKEGKNPDKPHSLTWLLIGHTFYTNDDGFFTFVEGFAESKYNHL